MKLLGVSNLYPRPDAPLRGMFNAQLFRELGRRPEVDALDVVCLVPRWQPWGREEIRGWTCPEGEFPAAVYDPVSYVPAVGRDWSGSLYARSARALPGAVARADVVFSSWLYPDGVATVPLAQSSGTPAWMMCLGTDAAHLEAPRRRDQIRDAVADAAGVVCVAPHLAAQLARVGCDPDKLHVVPNGVNTERFHYRSQQEAREWLGSEAQADWLGTPGLRLVLFVGNLVDVKAPDIALDAFLRLAAAAAQVGDGGPLHLAIVGRGPLQPALQARVRAREMTEQVHFLGGQPHERIALWMNAADGLCLTSHSEGMPNVILEALASGLPVVATDAGACRDLLQGVPHSLVVPRGSAGTVAKALNAVLNAEPDREAMAGSARVRGWDGMAEEIVGLIMDAR